MNLDYNDIDLISDDEEKDISPYSVEENSSSKTSNSSTTSNTNRSGHEEGTTTYKAEMAEVPTMEAYRGSLTANPSALQSALGVGQKPLADYRTQEEKAARDARVQAWARLAGNLGRGIAAQGDSVTGPIDKDASSNNYLQSMKEYRAAYPAYQKALATSNAKLAEAQGKFAKAQYDAQAKMDLMNTKISSLANYFKAKAQAEANRQFANNNRVVSTSKDTSGNSNTTSNTNASSTTLGGKEVRRVPTNNGNGRGNKSFTDNGSTIKYMMATPNGTSPVADIDMNLSDFRHLLNTIEALSNPGNSIYTEVGGLTSNRAEKEKIARRARDIQKKLQDNYYSKFGKPENVGDTVNGQRFYNATTLSADQLNSLWEQQGQNLLNLTLEIPYLAPISSKAKVTFIGDDNQGKTMNFIDYIKDKQIRYSNSNNVIYR